MVEPLYEISVKCTYCDNSFKSMKVRPSFKKASKTDADFCVHYKDINPDYYVVRICPYCGYAHTENFSDKWKPAQREAFNEKVTKNWSRRSYSGERTWDETVQSYKLALLSAQIKEEKSRVIAGLLHHLAWLYRSKGDWEQEKRFLTFALEAYIHVYENEGMDLNNARLMYLMGELNRRLGRYNEAVKWFSRIINDRKIMDAAMIRASREQWTITREDMMAIRMELPEEMKQAT
ncbi:DUF2225 domain-containing protein [Paenibacillus aceris]|uniref:Uncharacterized protein (DUF2225 family) n=1 Tax=Paenibacillus aceris TaxID=869555 RepID=A0ABS4HVM1_9BACL|nr:DUF2225 domain-containing protein [Paenibacillus aceris]MBP1962595.1 uncharacterized protein (DUF2225 family) [Paenibacillus aceris]NHW37405.1 DUF2225 domain-containing protein [Paenibacillus aceris]